MKDRITKKKTIFIIFILAFFSIYYFNKNEIIEKESDLLCTEKNKIKFCTDKDMKAYTGCVSRYCRTQSRCKGSICYRNGYQEKFEARYYDGVEVIEYIDGGKSGSLKDYYKNGALKYECSLKYEKCDGEAKRYYENGQIRSISNYIEGKPYGITKTYRETGQLIYENSEPEWSEKEKAYTHFEKKYYKNGQLAADEKYKDRQRSGIAKYYYEDGKLQAEINYRYDKKDELAKAYHKKGYLLGKIGYKDDNFSGVEELYYENGQIAVYRTPENLICYNKQGAETDCNKSLISEIRLNVFEIIAFAGLLYGK